MHDHATKEDVMKYMLLIHQGTTPLPGSPAWDDLTDDQKQSVYSAYQSINQTPGVTPGLQMQPPETATTVRVQDGRTLTTDGPFVETKEALGGYYLIEANDLDQALAIGKLCPAGGGGVEVRPIMTFG
jgi:hypothetical protein